MNISSWNGTLSSGDFYSAAITLSEKWEQMNPALPSWKWVPLPRSPWVASHEAEGYLSLENFCIIKSDEEVHDERALTGKEDSSYPPTDESIDDATLSYAEEIHFYDFHIVHSASYGVPVLYFHAYFSDGRFLALDDIKKDLPPSSLKMLKESKWTFITSEEHPYLNRPWYTLHPCGTSEWMKLLFLGNNSLTKEKRAIQLYLVSWLSVVGQVVGLRIPLGMLSNSHQWNHSSSVVNGSSLDETLSGIVHTQSSLG
ncbi:ubiquitin-like-conjugating enzyme ATG10 isoform X2 [Telopea speciosissima]|uniref:ubiquitin-like-conjugating enzyme ATG10 isoform X2 n=1 Tax=Telopea speciosissima TaxID=54955 RepID=UPI001CC39CAD|nr:ubiquitin-like-conjugating enzyme ATG10 isoform X2 [Telopea speciosissima]